ncbi:MAG: flagellar biosynthesis anti-sigma factor FlgM [Deltaproteobacteria bacterium]|nr:flagellar biosynthesis anti-sigma factor FlgM [Deltaproteobacteria bacterium]
MISRIKDTPPQGIQQYQKNEQVRNETDKPVAGGAAVAAERVDLSAKAKEFQQIRQILDETPDVREGKVQELKDRIESGSYTIDAGKIAAKMLGESLIDTIA